MQKAGSLAALLFLLSGTITLAQYVEQAPADKKNWNFSQIDFAIGLDNDHYGSMSYDDIMNFAKNPEDLQRDLGGMTEDAVTVTRGAAFYTNMSFSPLNKNKDAYRDNRELRLGMGIHSNKEAMLSYKNEALDTSIVYCNVQSEFSLEAAYLFTGKIGKRIHYYYGIGAGLSASFNNQMILISGRYFGEGEHPSEQESYEKNVTVYDARPVGYTRIYCPYGIGYGIGKRCIVGLDFRTGLGIQQIVGKDPKFLQKTGSFLLGFKYRL